MKVNIRCPVGKFGSLPYLGEVVADILKELYPDLDIVVSGDYIKGYHNILIDEAISSVAYQRVAEVWWTDTPAMMFNSYHKVDKLLSRKLFDKHYTVSKFCVEHYNKLGIKVSDTIIPRPVNPLLFTYNTTYDSCEYDIFSIGRNCECDRKNLRMQRDIVLDMELKYCVVTDLWMPDRPYITKYDFGSIDDTKKAELLSKSKFLLWTSFVEGFGMPVLEAMTVGTVPIYTDVPAHNEFAVGIPIKPADKIKSSCYGVRVIKYVIDKNDVVEAIKYAIGMGKEEWENLSWECISKAVEMWNDFISKVSLLISV